jgi:hypothetical protein
MMRLTDTDRFRAEVIDAAGAAKKFASGAAYFFMSTMTP